MNLSLILFLIGILGFVLNRKNRIIMLISIEIMLLAITYLILVNSMGYDDTLATVGNNLFINSDLLGVELNSITYLGLIILPLLGSIVFGFLPREVEISRARLIFGFIAVFMYVINIYLSKSYFVNIDWTIVVNLALLIGAIAGLSQITLNVENKNRLVLQAISTNIISIYLINLTIPLHCCSTPVLLCIWIGAVTAVFTCSMELYNITLKTKPLKIFILLVIFSIYLDYEMWVVNLSSANKTFY